MAPLTPCNGKDEKVVKTYRRRRSLLIQIIVTFVTGLSLSLYPPYYPQMAGKKGASNTLIGIVLGSNCLTAFLLTPLVGRNLPVIGHRFAFFMGIIINGVCCMLTGFLDEVPTLRDFIILSIAIRVVSALGNAGLITASFSFLAFDFPNNVAQVFALNRLIMNLGQLMGPAIGGALFEIGGFRLPFIALGCVQVVVALVSVPILPKYKMEPRKNKDANQKDLTLWNIFKIPPIYIAFSVFIVSTMANGFLSLTLEPHILRPYGMNKFHMGLIYGIKDGTSSLATPLWGFLCDKTQIIKIYILICCSIMSTSFFVLGPFPGIPIIQSLWLLSVSLGFYGVGVAGLQVGGVMDAYREVLTAGYADDPVTHGCVAGIWSSFTGLGRFLARSTSGILTDHIGFQFSTVVICGLLFFVMTLIALYYCVRWYKKVTVTKIQDLEKYRKLSGRAHRSSSKLLQSYEFHCSQSYADAL